MMNKNADEATTIRLTRKKLEKLLHDSVRSAEIINLVYVTDKDNGIRRERRGDGFVYLMDEREVEDPDTLFRIRSLVIPPAWTNVWICANPNGHIQVVGLDANGRKQYRYHPLWNAMRSETKFFQMYEFGKALPGMRKRISGDLALPGLPQQKVMAAIVSLMQFTGIRIGNNMYEKLYGSFGLSTLKDKHVKINGQEMRFSFRGKKGVLHNITLRSRKLARIVRQCREIPGKELFQYYDDKGQRKTVDSGMVNDYIREVSGGNFTSKDFRTWTGTLSAIKAFIEIGYFESSAEEKRRINEAIDRVAGHLGNTRNVCRKYYIHPVVLEHYSNKSLEKFFTEVAQPEDETGLTVEEQILMNMLSGIRHAQLKL